jgi:hypothetical protein
VQAALKHFTDPDFWLHYRQLPDEIRLLADKKFALLKSNPRGIRQSGLRRSASFIPHELMAVIVRSPESAATACNGFGLVGIQPTIDCSNSCDQSFR